MRYTTVADKSLLPPIAGIDMTPLPEAAFQIAIAPPIAGIDTYQTHRQDSHRPIAPHCGD